MPDRVFYCRNIGLRCYGSHIAGGKLKSRRQFLTRSVALGITLAIPDLTSELGSPSAAGATLKDKKLRLFGDLGYRKFSPVGLRMDDGTRVPELHDGMGCFQARNGNYVLVRNHEIAAWENSPLPDFAYDSGCRGGTTTIELTPELDLVGHHLSLTGTLRNCAGGETPWNTWLSCEEIFTATPRRPHGYVFEVDPFAAAIEKPRRLTGLGRFRHEAVGVTPAGIAYLTEDQHDSCFYRFVPRGEPWGTDGTLEALKVVGRDRYDTARAGLARGASLDCEWVAVPEPDPGPDSVRYQAHDAGAALIMRGEGIAISGDAVYFTATTGGRRRLGQIFRYTPRDADAGTLTLVYECTDDALIHPDNLTVSPWGDLIVCEDREGRPSRLVGLTADSELYPIAENANGEWAGACFSPDGKVLFANNQVAGYTLALTGLSEAFRRA